MITRENERVVKVFTRIHLPDGRFPSPAAVTPPGWQRRQPLKSVRCRGAQGLESSLQLGLGFLDTFHADRRVTMPCRHEFGVEP